MALVNRAMLKVAEFVLHLVELHHEVTGKGEHQAILGTRKRRPSAPRDASCYPHYGRLDRSQVVYEEDFP